MLTYPNLDPVAIHLGPLAIRWYSLAYIGGILLGWFYVLWLNKRKAIPNLTQKAIDDMVVWAVLGVVGGGRLGYVLFYKPHFYLENPSHILKLWEGGMSFHGGCLGVILAFIAFARKYKVPFWPLIDVIACAAPIGLFLGRIANFINGELYGRVTDSPLGMIFPTGGPEPRHPSQLYQAGMEGIILFTLLFLLARFTNAREKPGMLGGAFIAGYGIARIIGELFREPDAFLGFLFAHVTMGQLLSTPMVLYGLYLVFRPKHWPPIFGYKPVHAG